MDSIRQVKIKDSIHIDSINKAANIEVKKVELTPVIQEKVDSIIQQQEEGSFLKGKLDPEIFKMYEAFANKYDRNNKAHQAELKKWTNDRLFQDMKKKEEWVEKIEKLEEKMQAKK